MTTEPLSCDAIASSLSSLFTSMLGVKPGKEAGPELGLYVVVGVDDAIELDREVWRILKSFTSSAEGTNMSPIETPLLKALGDVLSGLDDTA